MNPNNSNISKVLKKMKSNDFIYLTIIIVFFTIVIILFSHSTDFIIKNINKMFSPAKIENTQSLNMENYSLTIKKLSLPTNTVN